MEMQYRREIDGLRALAVVPVVLFHAGVPGFSGGFVGVDVFFVISGYLITTILLNELQVGVFSIVRFYERRIRRILPALFLVMLVSLPFAWFWLTPADMKAFSKSLVAVVLFVPNFLFLKETGYFDAATELKPFIHTWSLAVEEQFYLLFPMMLFLIWRWGRARALVVLMLLFMASLIASQWASYHFPAFSFFMLPTRTWELGVGVLVAFFRRQCGEGPLNIRISQAGGVVGLFLITYSLVYYSKETLFPGLYALVPTVGAALIILFATRETWTGKLLGSSSFVGVGLVSYSAYLWHQPIFAFARIRSDEVPSTTLMLLLCAMTFLLAYLSWRYVEKPFRRKDAFSRKQIFVYASIASLFFISIGMAGQKVDSFADHRGVSDARIQLLETAKSSPKRKDCHTDGENYTKPFKACEYFGREVTWAVLGDSHAVELAYAMASELRGRDIGVKHLSFSACAPSFQMPAPHSPCEQWTDEAVAYLEKNPDVRTVVISYRLNQHLFGYHEKSFPVLPNDVSESRRSEVWGSYTALIKHLLASGKRLVVVLQAPELRKGMGDLVFRAGQQTGDIVGVPAEWWRRRNAYVLAHRDTIPDGVTVIDPSDLFCDDQNCYASRGMDSLYFDDDHMSVAGAQIVARHILDLVK